jgi:DNA-binding GntR family transcriptional regulator
VDKVVGLLGGEKKDIESALALVRALDKLAQDQILLRWSSEGIEVTIPELVVLELKLQEFEEDGTKRDLELELEWIDEDESLGRRTLD